MAQRAAAPKRKVAKTGPFRWEATLERNPNDWRRHELVGLEPSLSLDDLVLNWTERGAGDLEAAGALAGLKLENTIDGVPTVTMSVLDPQGTLFDVRAGRMRPPVKQKFLVVKGRKVPAPPAMVDEGWDPIVRPELIGKAMEVELNGVVFRLVKVGYQHSTGATELTFEHRTAYWLKRKRGEFRASRSQVTRAEFILGLLRQIRTDKPPFICPQLHKRQPVEAQSQTLRAGASPGSDQASTGDGGFSPNARITVKHVPATAEQRRALDAILGEAARMGASRNVMIACVMCTTQESGVQPLSHGDAARNDTIGYFQQGPEWIDPADTKDPAACVHAFLDGKNGNSWRKKYGSLDKVPGGYEQAIKGVQVSIGHYAQWEDEATRTVEAWGGAAGTTEGGASSTPSQPSRPASYQFSRNKDEHSWAAIARLAEEVGWRFFLVGPAAYYMSEEELYARRPRYTVRPDDDSVLELSYDVDWGSPVSEATLTINLERWGAPVGSIVELEDFGPPDGRWLVTGNSREWFSPMAELTLRQPGKAKLEPATPAPAAAVSASAKGEGEGDVGSGPAADRLYAACQQISDKGYPYIWGGGHGTAGVPSGAGGTSHDSGKGPGYDCSGSTAAALKMAGLAYTSGPADVSGTMAGKWQAGKGQECTIYANGEHVWIGFDKRNDRFDTSPHGGDRNSERGPRLRGRMRSDTGSFSARHIGGM